MPMPVATIASTTYGHLDIMGIPQSGVMIVATGFPLCNGQPTVVTGDKTMIFPHPHALAWGAPTAFLPHVFTIMGTSFVMVAGKQWARVGDGCVEDPMHTIQSTTCTFVTTAP